MSRHRWLYIPDLASSTGWATHDAEHGLETEPTDAIGFRWLEPLDDLGDATDITNGNVDNRRELTLRDVHI